MDLHISFADALMICGAVANLFVTLMIKKETAETKGMIAEKYVSKGDLQTILTTITKVRAE